MATPYAEIHESGSECIIGTSMTNGVLKPGLYKRATKKNPLFEKMYETSYLQYFSTRQSYHIEEGRLVR